MSTDGKWLEGKNFKQKPPLSWYIVPAYYQICIDSFINPDQDLSDIVENLLFLALQKFNLEDSFNLLPLKRSIMSWVKKLSLVLHNNNSYT